MWWQYIVTLVIALITVWFAQWLSTRTEYKKALKNLRSEVFTNIRTSGLLCAWVDTNLAALKGGRLVVASCPHFYDSAWTSSKGDLANNDCLIVVRLEASYGMIAVINNLLHTIEGLKWGVVETMTNIHQGRESVLKYTKETAENSLLPELENASNLLDKKLKKSSSVEGQTRKA